MLLERSSVELAMDGSESGCSSKVRPSSSSVQRSSLQANSKVNPEGSIDVRTNGLLSRDRL
jgi:hypothetical protein